jgi:hypothetical protein
VRGRIDPERHAADDGHARGGKATPEATRHLEPVVGRAAGADDRDRGGLVKGERDDALRIACDVQDRRCVGAIQQPAGILLVVSTDGELAHLVEPPSSRLRVKRLVRALDRLPTIAGQRREQAFVRQRQQLAQVDPMAPSAFDMRRETRDERGTPQTVVASAHAAARPPPRTSSWRSESASLTCSAPTCSLAARSPIVRATRRIRPWPRTLSSPLA